MQYRTVEEQRWHAAVDNAVFGVWDLDPRLETVHYSPRWKERLGFPRVDAPDSTWFWRCRVHPDDFDAMVRSLRSHLDGDTDSYQARFRLRVNGSGYRTVLSRGRVVARHPCGMATRMVGTMIDLSNRPLVAAAVLGLAAEVPTPIDPTGLPFHAVLGAFCATQGSASEPSADRRENERLIDLVGDLLEIALHEAGPARPNGPVRQHTR